MSNTVISPLEHLDTEYFKKYIRHEKVSSSRCGRCIKFERGKKKTKENKKNAKRYLAKNSSIKRTARNIINIVGII